MKALAIAVIWMGYAILVYGADKVAGNCTPFKTVAWPSQVGGNLAVQCSGSTPAGSGSSGSTSSAGSSGSTVSSAGTAGVGAAVGTGTNFPPIGPGLNGTSL